MNILRTSWVKLVLIVVAGLILCVVCMVSFEDTARRGSSAAVSTKVPAKAVQPPKELSAKDRLRLVLRDYMKSKDQLVDTWWLDSIPQDHRLLIQPLKERKNQFLAVLDQYKTVSPLAGQIAARFSKPMITVHQGGASFTVIEADDPLSGVNLEVCYIPRTGYDPKLHPSSLYWEDSWGAMKIVAMNLPPKVFAGILFHEAGHGECFFERKHENMSSDENISEEVTMHELELAVTNKACDGQYVTTLDRIVAKYGFANWQETLRRITVDDLKQLDIVVGAELSGPNVSGIVVAQHLMVIGLRAIERNHTNQQEKIILYRWLESSVLK